MTNATRCAIAGRGLSVLAVLGICTFGVAAARADSIVVTTVTATPGSSDPASQFSTAEPGAETFFTAGQVSLPALGSVSGGLVDPGGSTNPNFGSTGDWLSTAPGQPTIEVALTHPSTYVGFLWSSTDSYNIAQVSFSDGTSATLQPGQGLLGAISTSGTTGYFVNITDADGARISGLSLSSSACCFEVNNFATLPVATVPEPSAVGLAALGGVLLLARRRQRTRAS